VAYENLPTSATNSESETLAPQTEVLASCVAQLERIAIATFFDDYAVVSADHTVSRGFLDGLKLLIQNAGESSDITQAMRIVALAGAANRTGHMSLLHRSRLIYGQLLGSLHRTFPGLLKHSTMESLMTIALLGIYEVFQRDGCSSCS
jgi:hypothetical protein